MGLAADTGIQTFMQKVFHTPTPADNAHKSKLQVYQPKTVDIFYKSNIFRGFF